MKIYDTKFNTFKGLYIPFQRPEPFKYLLTWNILCTTSNMMESHTNKISNTYNLPKISSSPFNHARLNQ